MASEVDLIVGPLSGMSLDDRPSSQTEKSSKKKDLARLEELGCIEGGMVKPGFSFDTRPTVEMEQNLAHFLTAKRSIGYSLQELFNETAAPSFLGGEDLEGIIGWEFLSSRYLALAGIGLMLSDVVSAEHQELAEKECKTPPHLLQLRFPLSPTIPEGHHQFAEAIRGKLVQFIGEEHLSATNTFDVADNHYSGFWLTSLLDGHEQRIYFMFYTSKAESLQIPLCGKIELQDFGKGNQWCVDTMHKILRVDASGRHFSYLRKGYEPDEKALDFFRSELMWPPAYLDKCNKGYDVDDERCLHNILLICKLSLRLGKGDLLAPFLETALQGRDIDSKKSFWHASLKLLQQKALSFQEWESLLGLLGTCACTFQAERGVEVLFAEPHLVFRNKNKGAEFTYKIQVVSRVDLDPVLARIANLESGQHLVDTLLSGLRAQRSTPPLVPVMPVGTSYLATTLMACLPSERHLFRQCLRVLPGSVRSASPTMQHMIGSALRLAFASQEDHLPAALQDGGLGSQNLETEWIDFLLQGPHRNVGRELLLQLPGHDEFKLQWADKLLDPSLIQQLQSSSCVTDAHIKKWLKAAAQPQLLWFQLASSPESRWLSLLATSYPTHLFANLATLTPTLTSQLFRALFTSGDLKELTPAELKVACEHAAEWDDFSQFVVKILVCLPKKGTWNEEFTACFGLCKQSLLDTDRNKHMSDLVPVLIHPEAVKHDPALVQRTLDELDTRKYELVPQAIDHLRACVKSFVMRAKLDNLPLLGMRYLVVHQHYTQSPLDTTDATNLLTFMEAASTDEFLPFYFSLVGSPIPYKLEPVRQVRIFLQAFIEYPESIQEEHKGHINELRKRIQDVSALQEEIAQVDAESELFACFFPKKKEKPSAPSKQPEVAKAEKLLEQKNPQASTVEARVNALLDLESPDPSNQVFKIFEKFSVASPTLWLKTFTTFSQQFDSAARLVHGIGLLFRFREKIDKASQKKLWQVIFSNSLCLSSPKMRPLFRELDFFKTLFADTWESKQWQQTLVGLVRLLLANPRSLFHAYRWYETIHDGTKEKPMLGFDLIAACKPTTDQDFMKAAGRVARSLHTHVKAEHLPKLKPYCALAKVGYAYPEINEATITLLGALDKFDSHEASLFAVNELHMHKDAGVRDALWPSLKKLMKGVNQDLTRAALPMGILLPTLLARGSTDVIIDMYSTQFLNPERSPSKTPYFAPDPQEVVSDPCELYTRTYARLLARCLVSTNPQHCTKALEIDFSISRFYPGQAKQIARVVKRHSVWRKDLFLRQIQFHGWSSATRYLFDHYAALSADSSFGHFYSSCTNPLYYGYDPKADASSEIDPPRVGSLYPRTRANPSSYIEQVNDHITASLSRAEMAKSSQEQRVRLLNFALQNLRNVMVHFPQSDRNFPNLLSLAFAVSETDPLFSSHREIILGLLKLAARKEITPLDPQTLSAILLHIGKTEADLLKEPDSVKDSEIGESVEQKLVRLQRELQVWQAMSVRNTFPERQRVLEQFFKVWVDCPQVLCKKAITYSMEAVLMPDALFFGQDRGEEGIQAARDALTLYLDTLDKIYSKTVVANPKGGNIVVQSPGKIPHVQFSPGGQIARFCLEIAIEMLGRSHQCSLFTTDYDRFCSHAMKIMQALKAPAFFSLPSVVSIYVDFTALLLHNMPDPQDELKRIALMQEWEEVVKGHDKDQYYQHIRKGVDEMLLLG